MENGLQTAEYYRPSQKRFDDALARAAVKKTPLADAAALAEKYQNGNFVMTFPIPPSGMVLSTIDDRLAVALSEDWASQYRRTYGYLGEIKLLPA